MHNFYLVYMPTIVSSKVTVNVEVHPFSIVIRNCRGDVLRRLSSDWDYSLSDMTRAFRPRVTEMDLKSMVLSDDYVQLFLSVEEETIRLKWSSKEKWNYLLDSWHASGGYWYSQRAMAFQVYPYSNHVSINEPYLATDFKPPFWASSLGFGIFVKSYGLFDVYFNGSLSLRSRNSSGFEYVIYVDRNLRKVRNKFVKDAGLPEKIPDRIVFEKPIFSTWAEYHKDIDEQKVREYTRLIREYELPCSVVEIDDKWEPHYGDFDFDREKFPKADEMVKYIHEQGYLVTLWTYPYINLDSFNYRYAKEKNYFVLDPERDEPATVRWWNGEAGLIDISNPEAAQWFSMLLDKLKKKYRVDGFKFDAGDAPAFPIRYKNGKVLLGRTYGNITPNMYTDLWLKFIYENHYNLAEVRVGYLGQRYGIISRQEDKASHWGIDNGLKSVISEALTMSLVGYPYIMPDMIGGNEYKHKCSKELFIRWVESVSLMPILQFSIAPWRFDDETIEITKKYINLHLQMSPYIFNLARQASRTGKPIVYPLALRFPEDDISLKVWDEYLVGNLLIAPVLERGAEKREVYLPHGYWIDFWTFNEIRGPETLEVEAPLDLLPMFIESHDNELLALVKKAQKIFS